MQKNEFNVDVVRIESRNRKCFIGLVLVMLGAVGSYYFSFPKGYEDISVFVAISILTFLIFNNFGSDKLRKFSKESRLILTDEGIVISTPDYVGRIDFSEIASGKVKKKGEDVKEIKLYLNSGIKVCLKDWKNMELILNRLKSQAFQIN